MQETRETQVQSLGLEDALEQEMAPYSVIMKFPYKQEMNRYDAVVTAFGTKLGCA